MNESKMLCTSLARAATAVLLALPLVPSISYGEPAARPSTRGGQPAQVSNDISGAILNTELASQDHEKLVFRGSVEVAGTAGRPYQVLFQVRLHRGDFLRLPGGRAFVRVSEDGTTPDDGSVARLPNCRVEIPLRDLELAVNLPTGRERILWVDCSVYDVTAHRYNGVNFTVSTPLLVTTDSDGRITEVDADGVWEQLVRDEDQSTAVSAMWSGDATAARARAVLPAVVAVLHDSDDLVRRANALRCLQRIQRKYPQNADATVAAFRAALTDKDAWNRRLAAEGLADGGHADEAIPVLVALLTHTEESPYTGIRAYPELGAGEVLEKIGWPAVPALRRALHDDELKGARHRVAVVLLHMGVDAQEAAAALIDAFRQAWAAEGKDSKAVAILRGAFDAIGPSDGETVPVLLAALQEDDPGLRPTLVQALGRIGPAAAPAVSALIEMFHGDDAVLRREAAAALKKIDPEAARQAGVR